MEEKLQELRHAAQTEYYEKAGTKAQELLSATFTKNTYYQLVQLARNFIALALWYSLSRRTLIMYFQISVAVSSLAFTSLCFILDHSALLDVYVHSKTNTILLYFFNFFVLLNHNIKLTRLRNENKEGNRQNNTFPIANQHTRKLLYSKAEI